LDSGGHIIVVRVDKELSIVPDVLDQVSLRVDGRLIDRNLIKVLNPVEGSPVGEFKFILRLLPGGWIVTLDSKYCRMKAYAKAS